MYGEKDKKSGTRKRIGKVNDLVFHPSENRVVGFVVGRPDILFLFRRKDRMLALDRTRVLDDRIVVNGGQAWGKSAEKRLGFSWDKSVIWVGMPVVTESGVSLGGLRDGVFDPADGSLNGIGLTGGIAADVTIGVRDLPAQLVERFDGESIVISNEALHLETDGGAAAAAGKGAAVAGVQAAKAAAVAGQQATKAAVATVKTAKTVGAYGKSAAKVAAKSQTTRKAMGFLKSMRDQIVDAAGLPDDEDKRG